MRWLVSRLPAVLTLTALLACSGLGVCWKQFASVKHHCCAGGDTKTTQVKPCASLVNHEASVVMPAPQAATLPVTVDPSPLADAPPIVDPLFPAKGPPLILRI